MYQSQFQIRVAKSSDARLLHAFLFARPDNHIRELTLDDVIGMIRDRVFHIVECLTEHNHWEIAGACYIDGPPGGGPGDFELGGAYVAPEYRGFGLFRILATSAIVNHLATDAPFDSGQQLIAHVHRKNDWPRTTLERLGFKIKDADVAYPPDAIPGLSHMPKEDDGCIHADTYVFPKEQCLTAIDAILEYSGTISGKDGESRKLAIAVPALALGLLREIREDVIKQLREPD